MMTIKSMIKTLTDRINNVKKVNISRETIQQSVATVVFVLYKASLLNRDETQLFGRDIAAYHLDERFKGLIFAQEVVLEPSSRMYANVIKHWNLGDSDPKEPELKDEVSPADFVEAQDIILNCFKKSYQRSDTAITSGVITFADYAKEAFNSEGFSNATSITRLPVYVTYPDVFMKDQFYNNVDETLVDAYCVDVVLPALRS